MLPLLTAQGALADVTPANIESSLLVRLKNKRRLSTRLREAGWKTAIEVEGSRTGIVVASPPTRTNVDVGELRLSLKNCGIVATVDKQRRIRFSMPGVDFSEDELGRIDVWIRTVSNRIAAVCC